jgi:hypothetical protein
MIQIKVKDELILFSINDAFETKDMSLRFHLDLFPELSYSKTWTFYKLSAPDIFIPVPTSFLYVFIQVTL